MPTTDTPNDAGHKLVRGKPGYDKQSGTRAEHRTSYIPCEITRPRNGTDEARLHLIDLDNLHGGANPTDQTIKMVRVGYEKIGFSSADLTFASCNHAPVRHSCSAHKRTFLLRKFWPKCSMRLAQGPDGADHKLLADAETFLSSDRLDERFADVVIASGDHIFTDAARRFRGAGLTVHVAVSNESVLSARLRAEVDGCIWLLHAGRCIKHVQRAPDCSDPGPLPDLLKHRAT